MDISLVGLPEKIRREIVSLRSRKATLEEHLQENQNLIFFLSLRVTVNKKKELEQSSYELKRYNVSLKRKIDNLELKIWSIFDGYIYSLDDGYLADDEREFP